VGGGTTGASIGLSMGTSKGKKKFYESKGLIHHEGKAYATPEAYQKYIADYAAIPRS